MRARIDVSEIEAKTKIRAKYLRALENEEWGLLARADVREELPAHLRASARASTGRRWSRSTACTTRARARAMLEPIVSRPAAQAGAATGRRRERRLARLHRSPSGSIGVVIVLLIVLLVTSGPATSSPPRPHARQAPSPELRQTPQHARRRQRHSDRERRDRAVADADGGGVRVPARRRRAQADPRRRTAARRRARRPTTPSASRSRSGNNSVTMYVDGRPRTVPPSSAAIGYSITKAARAPPLPRRTAADLRRHERPRGHRRHRHRGADGPGHATATARGWPNGCASSASTWRTSRSSATAPRTCARRSSSWPRQGIDLVAHQRRARADGRRPHGRGRGRLPGARDGARRGALGAHRRDRRAAAETLAEHRPGGDRGGQPQAGDGARGRRRCSSRWARRPGLVVPPPRHAEPGRPSSCCRGRRASCSRCGARRWRPRRCARRSPGATSTAQRTLRLFGIPESEIAETLRMAEREGVELSALEVTTCLKRGEVEVVTRYEPAGEGAYGAFAEVVARAPRRHALLRRRPHRRRAGRRRCCAAQQPHDRDRRVVHGRAARRPAHRSARLLRLHARRRSSPTPTRSRSRLAGVPAELIERHGAVSQEVAEALADGRVERARRRRRRRRHRRRGSRRGHAREAGRASCG